MKRSIMWLWCVPTGLSTIVFGLAYYQLYWRWRACFNEEGNCFDGVTVHHAQNEVLAVPLLASAIALAVGLLLAFRRLRGALS